MNNASSCSADFQLAPAHFKVEKVQENRLALWAARLFYHRKPCKPVTATVMHYFALQNSLTLPDGKLYKDTRHDLQLLRGALDQARLLHMIPPNAILEPNPYITYIPPICNNFKNHSQPHSQSNLKRKPHIEIWAEHTTAGYLFEQLARELGTVLIASPESFTFTTLWQFARRAAHIRREVTIVYITDKYDSNMISMRIRIQKIMRAFGLTDLNVQLTHPKIHMPLTHLASNYDIERLHAYEPLAPEKCVRNHIVPLL